MVRPTSFFMVFFLGGVGVGHDMPVFIARFEGGVVFVVCGVWCGVVWIF